MYGLDVVVYPETVQYFIGKPDIFYRFNPITFNALLTRDDICAGFRIKYSKEWVKNGTNKVIGQAIIQKIDDELVISARDYDSDLVNNNPSFPALSFLEIFDNYFLVLLEKIVEDAVTGKYNHIYNRNPYIDVLKFVDYLEDRI